MLVYLQLYIPEQGCDSVLEFVLAPGFAAFAATPVSLLPVPYIIIYNIIYTAMTPDRIIRNTTPSEIDVSIRIILL